MKKGMDRSIHLINEKQGAWQCVKAERARFNNYNNIINITLWRL